ncbi:MAG TPA: 4Fe-4S dicluster domain-containing protein [Candidatus Dormibacteraeota bacterium]|nr:4Fe-4S dicluster domain-containing protein [Candidatus Dormibacteraeota bacterium]
MTFFRRVPRWVIQLTCFVGAIVLAWPLVPWKIAPRFFQEISPFVSVSSIIATRSIGVGAVLALVVAIASSFKKRWFCLYLCPTGFLLENSSRFGMRKNRWWGKCPPVGRYVAILTIAGAIVGYPVLLWMDPLCIFTSPFALNKATNPYSVILVILGLGVLVGATFVIGMLWCVRICPLSGLQDMLYLSRKALWAKLTSGAASPKAAGRAAVTESSNAQLVNIAAARAPKPQAARKEPANRLFAKSTRKFSSARRVFFAGGAGALLALIARRAGAARYRKANTLLRPPGAVPEDRFAGLCIRCNNCTHACPSKIIHPDTGHEAGLAGFGAPVIKYDRDYQYCLETCNACSQVCPTGALTALAMPEKKKYVIGEAIVDDNLCLLVLGKKECDACELACPYDAIKIKWDEDQFISYPGIDLNKCNGCGACQVVCPVNPTKAIRVWTLKPS